LSNHIERLLATFTTYLDQNPFQGNPQGLYEAKNYLACLGGKRARPIALLAATEAAGGDPSKALQAAWAFEMFHNFTLAHDDIMDKADMRRGQPALHKKFDEPTAILAGDNMMLFVYQGMLQYPDETSIPLMKLITKTGIEICDGQFMDMEFEKMEVVTQEAYLEMITLKTAVLLGACLKAGGIVAGVNAQDQELLYDLGKNLGIGFQIKDDLLDAFSNNPKVGKVKGGDIIANKKTILYIKALEWADSDQKQALKNWFAQEQFDSNEKVSAVLDIFETLDVESKIESIMNMYYEKAFADIDRLSFNPKQMEPLKEFAQFIAGRHH